MADKLRPSMPFDSPTTHIFANPLSSSSSSPPSSFSLPPISYSSSPFSYRHDMSSYKAQPQLLPSLSTLMSPPEAIPYESFSRDSPAPTMMQESKRTSASLPSPPVTPMVRNVAPDATAEAPSSVTDPILYDARERSPSQPPLFNSEPVVDAVVDQHIKVRALNTTTAPHRNDYILALQFKSQVLELYNKDRAGWYRREKRWLMQDLQMQKAARYKSIAPQQSTRSPATIKGTPIAASSRKPSSAAPRKPKDATRLPRSPKVQSDGTPRTGRGGPRDNHGPINREDKKYHELIDLCPPINSLPHRPNSLKVDWKGAGLDLHNDPDRHLLHEDEVNLASVLRLDCATYLTSKRRIFLRRTECLKIGKEFRKTDAQQACKIDVNKASKLWLAFDKVGWLDEHWVRGHLDRV